MADTVDTVWAVMAVMVDTDTARGPLMPSPLPMPRLSPRLMLPQLPTTAMAAMVDMAAMADTALADTTARGQLMPTTAMAVMEAISDMARGPLTPMPTTAMAVMEAMVVMAAMADTAMARGLLTPMPTTAMAVMEA